MTPEEAGKCWCPMTRYRVPELKDRLGGQITGPSNLPTGEGMCIGPKCMAWREQDDVFKGSGNGYCGLAGPP